MVAVAKASGFLPGQRVKLLVTFMAWPASTGAGGCNGHRAQPRGPMARFLTPTEALVFVRYRDDVPGGCLVRGLDGIVYRCPVDYLEEPA